MGGRVQVLFVPFRGVAVPEDVPLLRWKRRAVWENRQRNGLVADVAEAGGVPGRLPGTLERSRPGRLRVPMAPDGLAAWPFRPARAGTQPRR